MGRGESVSYAKSASNNRQSGVVMFSSAMAKNLQWNGESLYPLLSYWIIQEKKGATMQKANVSHGEKLLIMKRVPYIHP
jgi:hypothetical protein